MTKAATRTEKSDKAKSPQRKFDMQRLRTDLVQEQDKSSDIEQQPPFGDRKISNIQPQNRGGGGVHNQQEQLVLLPRST